MRYLFIVLLFVFAVCIGCGTKTAGVSGTVTLDGVPAENIQVLFQSVSKEAVVPPPGYGLTNQDGHYTIHLARNGKDKQVGVVPGEYAVFISWRDPNPPAGENQSHPCPYKIPEEAERGLLRYTVNASGPHTADFHLKSSKNP